MPPRPVTPYHEINRIKPMPGQTSILLESGLELEGIASDPVSPANGTLWFNYTQSAIKLRSGGVTHVLGSGGWDAEALDASAIQTGRFAQARMPGVFGISMVGGGPMTESFQPNYENGEAQTFVMAADLQIFAPQNGVDGCKMRFAFTTNGGPWQLNLSNFQMPDEAQAQNPVTLPANRAFVLEITMSGWLWQITNFTGPHQID